MVDLNLGDERWFLVSKPGRLIHDAYHNKKRVVSNEKYERENMESDAGIELISSDPEVERVVSQSEFKKRWKDKGYEIVAELTYMEAQEKSKQLTKLR